VDIAEKLCDSVSKSLEGTKTGQFTTLRSVIKKSLEEALTRILTPKKSINVLREVYKAQSEHRPYVIAFIGVNGVGKSTNLAKVAYFLKQNNMKVLVCACDTFRSGAVEQLRTHTRALDVPLFERGYEKDPALIAQQGIKEAKESRMDVVLIDTAGRMQDNEPLMRALAKLVDVNHPDLTLFVGEALVGNESVDQLTKFNRALVDFQPKAKNPRSIDGIILTKFDTVDDKVGAALSMVYVTGQPIVFVGCGQTYTDLRNLHVKAVTRALLK
jgi:signal recognition particle receptor subunit alpha